MTAEVPSAPPDGVGPRAPRPDPRFNIYGGLGAAAAAALAYVAALSADVLPSRALSALFFSITPVFAAFALAVTVSRAREEDADDLAWAAAGITVAIWAMVLQILSFPAISDNGGIFGTSDSANAALYLLFHLAFGLGALFGALRIARRWIPGFVVLGLLLGGALATELVPIPMLISAADMYTPLLVALEFVLAGVILLCTAVWVFRAGRAARPLNVWIGIGLSLSVYDVVLNAVAARRFDAVWWSSLSMRTATYGVVAAGAVAAVLRQLRQAERYSEDELTRREDQLRASLQQTQTLLARATTTAKTLQEALLPHAVVAPAGVSVAGRYRAAGEHEDVGGDWYDTIMLPGGGLALIIGDVEGHDVRAASIMGLVRGAVRSYALERHPPSVVIERVNTFLASAGIERKVSLSYLELYPNDRVVTLALADHPPPLLVLHDGGAPVLLNADAGPAMGGQTEARWTERTLLLPPDSSVVLYTDGALQGPDLPASLRDLLDVAGGAVGLASQALADRLVEQAPYDDDVAVLVARPSAVHAPSIQRLFPVDRISAAIARTWVADLFVLWQTTGLLPESRASEDCGEVVQLLLTELISNAVRHSEQPIRVTLALSDHGVHAEVHDSSHRMPVMRRPESGDTSGRGLLLVDTLSTAWGIEVENEGKTVWFQIDPREDADASALDEDALLAAFADGDWPDS